MTYFFYIQYENHGKLFFPLPRNEYFVDDDRKILPRTFPNLKSIRTQTFSFRQSVARRQFPQMKKSFKRIFHSRKFHNRAIPAIIFFPDPKKIDHDWKSSSGISTRIHSDPVFEKFPIYFIHSYLYQPPRGGIVVSTYNTHTYAPSKRYTRHLKG